MRRGLILALLPLLLHCGGDDKDKPTLDVVANKITFKSVENLGAHHMLATIRQESVWTEGDSQTHEETVELAWNNWDSFHLRRVVRGSAVGETVVDEGQSYHRGKGPNWRKEIDVEPARLRVRASWKVWDTAMDVFSGRVKLEETERSLVDGRAARRFKVSLAPLAAGRRIRSGAMTPTSLDGEVWLDEATAVRLSADVTATVEQKGMTRTITLHLRRARIGVDQTIVPPEESVQTPTDALKARVRNRRTRPRNKAPRQRNP